MAPRAGESRESAAGTVSAKVKPALPAKPHHELAAAAESAFWSCHDLSLLIPSVLVDVPIAAASLALAGAIAPLTRELS